MYIVHFKHKNDDDQEKGKEETRGDKFDLHHLSSSHCQEESCYDHAVF